MPHHVPPPTANTLIKRLLKSTLVSRDEFAKAAETVSSSALSHLLIERALDLTQIADDLRQQLRQCGQAVSNADGNAMRHFLDDMRIRNPGTGNFAMVGNRRGVLSHQHPRTSNGPPGAPDRPALQLVRSGE